MKPMMDAINYTTFQCQQICLELAPYLSSFGVKKLSHCHKAKQESTLFPVYLLNVSPQNSRSHQKQFLNIYSALESKAVFSLDSIAGQLTLFLLK